MNSNNTRDVPAATMDGSSIGVLSPYEASGDQARARDDMAKAYKYVQLEGYNSEFMAKLKQYGYVPKQNAQ